MDFSLRPFTPADASQLAMVANNNNIAKFLMDRFPHPYSEADANHFIKQHLNDNPATVRAIEVEGKVAGGIGLHLLTDIERKNAELGYWLAEAYWGQGIATRAIQQTVEYGFKHFDITRIFARPFGNNQASMKVLEKAGFTLEAILPKTFFKNDRFLDQYIYGIYRR